MNLIEIITTQQDPELANSLRDFVEAGLPEFKEIELAHKGSALGGISVAEAFWLYYLIKALEPKQIIESGTFHGYSLHFIRAAAAQSCRVLGFDIDMSHTPRQPGVEYHEHDWMVSDQELIEDEGTFVFFDDHINHDQRLYEAKHMKQRHLLFHDNYLSMDHSHRPLRFCALADTRFCYTFPGLYSDPIFTDTDRNAQTYRWLTYIRRGV